VGDHVVGYPVLNSCDYEVETGQASAEKQIVLVLKHAFDLLAEGFVYVMEILGFVFAARNLN